MRKSANIRSLILGNSRLIALIIILAGALVRFIALGSNPVGLNRDEASAGYETFALSNLRHRPQRQSVLYSYLSIPF